MKKQSDLSRLMGYAGNYRYFTYASWVLSGASALVALVPFVYIWKILRDVLDAAPNYAQAVNIPHYGWMAVLFAVLSYLIYIAALMCSHLSAFLLAPRFGLTGVWTAMCVELCTRGVLFLLRLARGKWLERGALA